MRPLDRPTMPPALQGTLARAWVPDIELSAQPGNAASLGHVTARQPRFRFVDDASAPSGARLVAETGAAERLLAAPGSSALVDALLGLRQLEPAAKLTGVAMSLSRNGAAANTLLADLESGIAHTPRGNGEGSVGALQQHADDVSWMRSQGMGAEYDLASGWMLLGPKFSASLTRATDPKTPRVQRERAAAEAGAVLAHETAHAVTPPSRTALADARWIEESTADLMLELPGARARIEATLGLSQPAKHAAAGRYYDAERGTLSKVLSLAGLDVRADQDAAAIRSLLQDRQLGHVPRRIAAAIAKQQGLPDTHVDRLRRAVLTAHEDGGARLAALVPLRGRSD